MVSSPFAFPCEIIRDPPDESQVFFPSSPARRACKHSIDSGTLEKKKASGLHIWHEPLPIHILMNC